MHDLPRQTLALLSQRKKRLAQSVSGLVCVVGLVVLAGWAWDIPTLKTVFPGLVTMKANTALGLMLSGLALVFAAKSSPTKCWRMAATILAVFVGVLGALSMSEYLFTWNPGIDELMFRDLAPSVGTSQPGRMSPSSAFCFMLAAVGLLAASRPSLGRWHTALIAALGCALLAMGGMGCVGQTSDVLFGFRTWNYFGMALHTATGFALLGFGLFAYSQSEGPMRWALDKRVTCGFVVAVAIMLTAAGSSWNYTHQLEDASVNVSRSHEVLKNIEEIRADRATLEAMQRGFIILGDEGMLANRETLRTQVRTDYAGIRKLAARNPGELKLLDQIDLLVAQRTIATEQILAARRQQGFTAAQQLLATGPSLGLGAQITKALDSMRATEEAELAARERNVDTTSTVTFLVLPAAVFLSLTLLALALSFLNEGLVERMEAWDEVRRLNGTLEQRVADRTEELEASNKELEAFSYSVSHDLRAPLRAIDGYSQAVLDQCGELLPPDGLRRLKTVRAGAQRMGRLIDDLLAFSRLGRAALNQGVVNMDKLATEVIEELRGETTGRNVEIRKTALPECLGDESLLKQVWVNLISNAIKYSRQRDPAVIEIGCTPGAQNTYFVRDNGAGFDMKYANKLFGVFQRLHRADQFEGTGVGLAIVHRIMHRLGGTVRADAAVDRGATFYFTLKSKKDPVHE